MISKVTFPKLFYRLRHGIIVSATAASSTVQVFTGSRYLSIIAHAIERRCSRCDNVEFSMVFATYLNCFILEFTASIIHSTFVIYLD